MADHSLADLAGELDELSFDRFDFDDAWAVGRAFQDHALREKASLVVSVFIGEHLVFHAASKGTSADEDEWVRRKARVVSRYGKSSLAVHKSFEARGWDFATQSRLDQALYAAVGGGVPIIVAGSVVGCIAISGMPPLHDHELAVSLLRKVLATHGASE